MLGMLQYISALSPVTGFNLGGLYVAVAEP